MSSDVTVVLKAVDQASAVMNKMGGGTKTLTNNLLAMAKAAGVVSIAYKGMEYLKDAVTDTVAYAEEVRDLSRALGINAEESSKLIQLADDMKIDLRQLQMAFRFALNKGVDPSIDGLKKLAVEYQAIEDPIEKAQFAMENFGTRGGLEMQKVLELSAEAIDEMAASAEAAGLVMSDEAAQAAREYEIAMDGLSDSAEGLKVTIGNSLIPVLTDLANELNRVMSENQQMNKMVDQTTLAVKAGIITQQEQAKIINEVATGTRNYNDILAMASEAELRLRDDRRESIGAMEDAIDTTATLEEATDDLAAAEDYAKGVLDKAIEAVNASNLGMAAKIELEKELKRLSGELTKEQEALDEALGYLTKQLELGNIQMDDYVAAVLELQTEGANAAGIIEAIGLKIENLPDFKEIEIVVKYNEKHQGGGQIYEDPDAPVVTPPEDYVPGPNNGLQSTGLGSTINNWNLTINEAGNRGNVVMDFEIMKALARA